MTDIANATALPLFNRVADQVRSMAGAVKEILKKPQPAQVDPDVVRSRVEQSSRIQARLMARQQRYQELVEFAFAADSADVAKVIIQSINADCGDAAGQILEHIALQDSRAALPAMIALYNAGASEILCQRMRNGDIERLVAAEKAEAFDILNLIGQMAEEGDADINETAANYFENLWEVLSEQPDKQLRLLGVMLGDPEPCGFRYVWEKTDVPQPVKLKALDLLNAIQPKEADRYFYYATRDQNVAVAFNATLSLIRHWQTERGRQPKNLEPFALLDTNLLFYCCFVAASFSWRGPTGVMSIFNQYCSDRDELEALDPVRDAARFNGIENRMLRLEQDIIKITENRVNALQPLIDRFTDLLQMPHARIEASDENFCAAYGIGTGTIKFNRVSLMEDKPMSEEFMSSVLHEINHMEQDVLVIRLLSDEINLKYGQHSKALVELYEMYAAAIGYAPESTFLLEVIRLRGDRPLSPAQRQRAERLYEALTVCREANEGSQIITTRMDRLGCSIGEVKDELYDDYLLSCIDTEGALKALFQSGHVPAVLLDEMDRCREDLDQLISQIYVSAGRPKPTRRSLIPIAQSFFASAEHKDLVVPIIARMRAVFIQVLEEEYVSLSRQRSRLMRDGYHEEEAYTVSDRVEVIVNALEKGWYKFNM